MESQEISRSQLLTMAVLVEGGMGVVACILALFAEVPLRDYLAIDAALVGWGLLASLPMILAFFVCIYFPVGPLRSVQRFASEQIKPLFQHATTIDLALICLFAGLGEEMLFRGVLQPWLQNDFEPWAALVLASLAFGLAHPMSPGYILLAGVFGLFLGWTFLATGSIIPAIIAHGLYDFFALTYMLYFYRDKNTGCAAQREEQCEDEVDD